MSRPLVLPDVDGVQPAAHEPEVLLLTGGSRGIGAAIARRAVDAGYVVCFTWSTDEEQAGSTAAGLGHVTAVVNNAGVTGPIGPFTSTSVADMRRVLDVNVLGALVVAREAVRRWDARASPGALVTSSSIAATLGAPHEHVPYTASKAAVEAMTVGLAKEVAARGIRVNAVAPGNVHTGIHAAAGEPRPARRGVPRADGSDRGAGRDRERRPVAALRLGVLGHGGGPAGVGGRVSPGSSDKAYIGWTPAAGRTCCSGPVPSATNGCRSGRSRSNAAVLAPPGGVREKPHRPAYLAGGSVVISRRTTLFRD